MCLRKGVVGLNLCLDKGHHFSSGSKRFPGELVKFSIAGEAEAYQALGGCHSHLYDLEFMEGKK